MIILKAIVSYQSNVNGMYFNLSDTNLQSTDLIEIQFELGIVCRCHMHEVDCDPILCEISGLSFSLLCLTNIRRMWVVLFRE